MKQSQTFRHYWKKETWESVYRDNDTNYMFSSFVCTFLNIFQASFPIKYKSINNKKIMTGLLQGIKISCKHKGSLYTLIKNSNDPKAKAHYIKYCRILRKVIKEAKKQHYTRLIAKSSNKVKTTWNVIKKKRQEKCIQQNWYPPYLRMM
jgi:hypothetical protein